MDFAEKSMQLDSGEYRYVDVGNAEQTILLLHGFAFRPGLYPLAEQLLPHFRVVIPDLPFSSKKTAFTEHSIHNYADFLLKFVHTLKLENVSIFGNSFGGTLALLCDLVSPGEFKNLIVRGPLWSSTQLPWYLRIKPLNSLHAFLSGYEAYAIWGLGLFYQISAQISSETEKAKEGFVPYDLDEISPCVLSRFLAELTRVEFTNYLRDIQAKTLIVWGENDTFIPGRWGECLEEMLPNGQFFKMPGEYHNIATVDAAFLARQIIDFAYSKH